MVIILNKERNWCTCLYFHALNKLTIKEKFPIPIIDDLLDEFHCAKFFSKLDLHLGYHQIRMKEVDIVNIDFSTYKGYYEFLVMPFGLCNDPSTFKILMNNIFNPSYVNF